MALKQNSFAVEQMEALSSGNGHHTAHPPSLVMGLTCACYSLPALAFWETGEHSVMVILFLVVTTLSVAADGFQLHHPLVRVADRSVATIAVIASIAINSVRGGPVSTVLCAAAVVSSVFWLRSSRAVSRHSPHDHGKWMLCHGIWHVYGALALSLVTLYSHRALKSDQYVEWSTLVFHRHGQAAILFFMASMWVWVAVPPIGTPLRS